MWMASVKLVAGSTETIKLITEKAKTAKQFRLQNPVTINFFRVCVTNVREKKNKIKIKTLKTKGNVTCDKIHYSV